MLGGLLSLDIPITDLTRFAEAGFLNEPHLTRHLDIEANDSLIAYSVHRIIEKNGDTYRYRTVPEN